MPTDDDKTVPDAPPVNTTLRGLGAPGERVPENDPGVLDDRTPPDPSPPIRSEAIAGASANEASGRLLEALGRRRRAERPVDGGSESKGADAASYYAQHELREGTKTPAPLPSVVLTRTAEMPTVPGARLQGSAELPAQQVAPSRPARAADSTDPIGTPLPPAFRAARHNAAPPVVADRGPAQGAGSALRNGVAIGIAVGVGVTAVLGLMVALIVIRANGAHVAPGAPTSIASESPPVVSVTPRATSFPALPTRSPPTTPVAPAIASVQSPPQVSSAVTAPMPPTSHTATRPPKPAATPAPQPTVPNRDLLE
jgi:hypothetical protein